MNTRYIFLLLVFLIGTVSCEDFLDVNTDPNNVTGVSMSALLPTTIEGTSRATYQASFSVSQVSQHLGSYFEYPKEEDLRMGSTWSTQYLKSMGNLNQIIEQAAAEESPHYAGVARILMALNLGMATDLWEDIPYSQAFNGSENLKPAYDAQSTVYADITNLLTSAIADLGQGSSVFSPGSDDLAFGGDLTKWSRLAHTLRARYAVHLLYKGGSYAADALNDIILGMQGNADDFELYYNDVNKNPWHTNVALANNTGNFSVSYGSYFMDHINGSLFGIPDPRLAVIADTTGESEYIGIKAFDPGAPANTLDFEESAWYSTEGAPIQMVTYAEAKFIEAEASLASGDRPRAYASYLQGIQAHMEKIGVEISEINNYLNHAEISVGIDALSLQDIMKEKYIALFLNPEAWVDMRRHNYDTGVYSSFVIPDPAVHDGPAQRAMYPLDELNRNGDNVALVQKNFDARMWRDQ